MDRATDIVAGPGSVELEEAVVWRVPPFALVYVREPSLVGGMAYGRHVCAGDPPPDGAVAYALHPAGCRCGQATRLWYVAEQDPYGPGPIEAVLAWSVAPRCQSIRFQRVIEKAV